MTGKVTGREKCLSPLPCDAFLLCVGIFIGGRVFRSLCYARGNNNALNNVESRLLGDNIRNNEAIRPRAVVLLSQSHARRAEK